MYTDNTDTRLQVLLARLEAPKLEAPKRVRDAQETLVLVIIELGNSLNCIRITRDWDMNEHQQVTMFENGVYTEMFESLYKMPCQCVCRSLLR